MPAIKQYTEVINGYISIQLPKDFTAKRVKLLIFPADEETNNDEFQFKKLNPKKNAYRMTSIDENEKLSNPFEKVEDVLSFAQSLREKAYR